MKHLQLIRLLVGRELTLRYKRSVIGIGWTLLNPMLTSFVLWVVFSFVFAGKLPDGQQYAPYLMAGNKDNYREWNQTDKEIDETGKGYGDWKDLWRHVDLGENTRVGCD